MRTIQLIVPIAALGIALVSFSAEAQERGDRRGRASQNRDQARAQSGDSSRQRGGRSSADRGSQRSDSSAQPRNRQTDRSGSYAQGSQRGNNRDSQSYGRSGGTAPRANNDRGRSNDRYQSYGGGRGGNYSYRGGNYNYRGGSGYGYSSYGRDSYSYRSYGYRGAYGYANGYAYSPYYYAPRALAYRYAPRRYYGSGGHLSIYFGFGSGYLYGAPYSGRVYGYRGGAAAYGDGQYYGDIRLDVNPSDAEVYVDGYYAGIVDDFDGQFQRLALEAGPHKIEIGARGLQSQVFDVYVDPSRTVDLRADLLR